MHLRADKNIFFENRLSCLYKFIGMNFFIVKETSNDANTRNTKEGRKSAN